jgi:hypothetical protein
VAVALKNAAAFNFIKTQFAEDIEAAKNSKAVSLLAKWLPSVNSSSPKTQNRGKTFAKKLGLSCKDYRKTLSGLRSRLDVVEVKMSANKWDGITYSAVPSKANVLYRKAFLKHDEIRRKAFLEKLKTGETKINSAVNFPHDITHQYRGAKTEDAALEELWKALPEYSIENSIVVADGSGSMYGNNLSNTGIAAIEIANALAVYYAERNKGEFKNKYITFSQTPKLVDLSHCETLFAKLSEAAQYNEVANTNIEAVFDLLLDTACANSMTQEELPANVLVISDMEFDSCVSSNSEGLINEKIFTVIKNRWSKKGYKLPRLIFWNVCSRTGTIPVKENGLGAALVSGFSPNVARMIMSGALDPFEALCEVLNSERYANILYG